jgi:hypothetical protein
VETTLPLALTARNVLARPVTARLVVVAEVVVESTAMRFVNVELAVEMMPLLKVWRALHVFALPKFKPMVLVVDPLYPPAKVRVPSAVRELRFNPRATPEMVELARYELLIEVVADTAPLVPKRRPEREPTDRPPVVVVEVTARVPVAVRLPPRKVLPETSRRFEGEVVPIPKLPLALKVVRTLPVLFFSWKRSPV